MPLKSSLNPFTNYYVEEVYEEVEVPVSQDHIIRQGDYLSDHSLQPTYDEHPEPFIQDYANSNEEFSLPLRAMLLKFMR